MNTLVKSLVAGGTVALVAASAAVTPAQAGNGGAVAAGVVGGLALGAIAGSAAAQSNGYYNNGYNSGYYAPAPAYAAPAYSGGGCYFTRQPVYDEDGYVVGRRRVRVCD